MTGLSSEEEERPAGRSQDQAGRPRLQLFEQATSRLEGSGSFPLHERPLMVMFNCRCERTRSSQVISRTAEAARFIAERQNSHCTFMACSLGASQRAPSEDKHPEKPIVCRWCGGGPYKTP